MPRTLETGIVGAGPAGLAAALYLHRAGHKVTVFERFERPAPVGSGLILQPTGLTVLHDLGLFSEIVGLGSRIDRLFGADARSGRTVLDVRYDARSGGRHGVAVHRAALFGVLHRAAEREGIAIETARDIDSVDAGERISLTGAVAGRLGPFDLVVDASGARSKLRSQALNPSEPKPLAFWASVGWRDAGFDRNALSQRYSKASIMAGVLPIGRPDRGAPEMAAVFWSLKPTDADAVRAAGIEALKARIIALWPEAEPFTSQINNFEQLSLARYGHHTLKIPAGRKLAIIGDAAHSTSPQLGQGANMALLDAAALNYAVGQSSTVEDTLELYARSRRRHVRLFQALSYAFTPFYQSDSTILPLIRDRLVATLAKVPPAPHFLASMVAGTVVDPFKPIGLSELDFSLPATQAKPIGSR